jgi:hypothetical protein
MASLPRTASATLFALAVLPMAGGCVAKMAADIVTAPVRVAGKGFDLATTSQSESDEKRGRALRHQEERLGRLQREYRDHNRQCMRGDDDACINARNDYAEMQNLHAAMPPPPRR